MKMVLFTETHVSVPRTEIQPPIIHYTVSCLINHGRHDSRTISIKTIRFFADGHWKICSRWAHRYFWQERCHNTLMSYIIRPSHTLFRKSLPKIGFCSFGGGILRFYFLDSMTCPKRCRFMIIHCDVLPWLKRLSALYNVCLVEKHRDCSARFR